MGEIAAAVKVELEEIKADARRAERAALAPRLREYADKLQALTRAPLTDGYLYSAALLRAIADELEHEG